MLQQQHRLKPSTSKIPQNPEKRKLEQSENEGRLKILNFIDDLTLKQLQKVQDEENEELNDEISKVRVIETNAISLNPCNKKPEKLIKIPKLRKSLPLIPEGSFYGLSKRHKQFLFNLRGISKLYDWQEKLLNLEAITSRSNLIYSTPTSSGKTLVSEILMLREVLLRKRNVIFLLPYISIVQEKSQDLIPLAVEYDFLIEEYCAGKGAIPPAKRRNKNSIYICTTEKGHILLDSLLEANRIHEISLLVVDELHMLGDNSRGHVLESLLTKIIYFEQVPIQIVGMSATISNIDEISRFLNAETFTYNFRPIELKEFVKTGSELYKIDYKSSEVLKKTDRIIGKSYTPQMLKRDPDHIGYFVYKAAIDSSCLIFCATKTNCENIALLVAECLPKELRQKRKDEKKNLLDAMKVDLNGSICPILAKTVPYGVAYHHSGLTADERKHVEEAFHWGILTVICCTSTLAAGVNLPASRVIIRSPYVGHEFISLTQYKQMIGRAGRTGKSEKGDSILICEKKDFKKVTDMLTSKINDTVSGYIRNTSYFRELILNLIGTGLCRNFDDLRDYSKCMLSRVQQEKYGMDMKSIFIETLKDLLNEGLVQQNFQSEKSKQPAILSYKSNGQDILVYAEDQFSINKLGRAAVSSGMSLDDARKIYADLAKAHESLVLSQCLHLLYVVAPKETVETIHLDYRVYSEIFLNLDPSLLSTAKVIGITEKTAIKMIKNPHFQDDFVTVLKRFYIALILYELWNGQDVFVVSKKFNINRGIVHKLMYSASSHAFSLFKFCEVFEEFWIFKEILEKFSKRLVYCCSTELLPLMELPAVKIGRAKMMYTAGLRTISDVAALTPDELIKTIKNINRKQAEQVIRAAKNTLSEQLDTLKAQMHEMEMAMKDNVEKI